jgi:hypothetical protein
VAAERVEDAGELAFSGASVVLEARAGIDASEVRRMSIDRADQNMRCLRRMRAYPVRMHRRPWHAMRWMRALVACALLWVAAGPPVRSWVRATEDVVLVAVAGGVGNEQLPERRTEHDGDRVLRRRPALRGRSTSWVCGDTPSCASAPPERITSQGKIYLERCVLLI